jgi:PKD repeat protein
VAPAATTPAAGGSTPSPATQVVPLVKPKANFSYRLYANGNIGFSSTSTGNIGAYSWNFGDGSDAIKSPNPTHQYIANGTYPVTLTVENSSGESSVTINVTISNVAIVVVETVDFTFAFSGLGVQFTDTSTKPGDRLWNFGDGTTSNLISPYYLYGANGAYTVTLTIQGVTKTQQVVVDRGVLLSWADNSSNETGFKIERSPDGSTGWTQIATTGANVHSLLVTYNAHGINPASINYFRVRAYNGFGNSGYTNVLETQCL